MRNLLEIIKESIEDGKYVDLPDKMYKPSKYQFQTKSKPKQERSERGPGGKKFTFKYPDAQYAKMLADWEDHNAKAKAKKKEAEDEWKKHVELVKKVDAENFEILIDKMLKLMEDKDRRDDFIKRQVSQILETIKTRKERGYKDDGKPYNEKNLLGSVNSFRKAIALDNDSHIKGNDVYGLDSFEEDIYINLYRWGSLYQIDVPNFSRKRDFKSDLFTSTVHELMDEWREGEMRSISDERYSKQYEKFKAQLEKDKAKVAKFRAAWGKTEQHKKLLQIADMIEDDVEKIEKIIDRTYTRYDELNGKDKAFRKAQDEVRDRADKEIEKVFKETKHAVTCYGKSLMDILVAIKLAGKDDPEIEVIDKGTSSWMSGMRHSCKFKVTDSDGNEYTTGKYEDRGFDSFERTAGDGFGPWD